MFLLAGQSLLSQSYVRARVLKKRRDEQKKDETTKTVIRQVDIKDEEATFKNHGYPISIAK